MVLFEVVQQGMDDGVALGLGCPVDDYDQRTLDGASRFVVSVTCVNGQR